MTDLNLQFTDDGASEAVRQRDIHLNEPLWFIHDKRVSGLNLKDFPIFTHTETCVVRIRAVTLSFRVSSRA
jgi:hypothetical protein